MKKQEKNMTENESVEKMIVAIKANGMDDSNYMVGYLGSMLVSLATKYPEVLKEVNATTDWIENK